MSERIATGGRPRREEIAEREEKLLDAAQCLFVRDGYAETSIEAIAKAASMSKKTIYSRYADKQALFRAVLFRMGESTFRAFPPITAEEQSFEAGLRRRASILFDILHDPRAVMLSQTVMREGGRFPQISDSMTDAFYQAVIMPLCDYVASWKARGAIRDIEPLFVVNSLYRLLSVNIGVMLGGIPAEGYEDWARVQVDRACDILLNGMLPERGPRW